MSPRRAGLAALGLSACVAAAHVKLLFLDETPVLRDHQSYTLPSREALGRALAEGRFPEWSDAVGLGTPLGANPAENVAYPPAWLLGAVPAPAGAVESGERCR